ncbi:MAG TPA: hypothetical protein PKG81_00505, partial [Candidatus Omnitrophota bacterium]|nr:hypothetical protein [Candidatus Omnitrophota bacterium]
MIFAKMLETASSWQDFANIFRLISEPISELLGRRIVFDRHTIMTQKDGIITEADWIKLMEAIYIKMLDAAATTGCVREVMRQLIGNHLDDLRGKIVAEEKENLAWAVYKYAYKLQSTQQEKQSKLKHILKLKMKKLDRKKIRGIKSRKIKSKNLRKEQILKV